MKRIVAASVMALAALASLVATLGAPSAQAAQLVSMPNGKGMFRIPANAKPDAIAFFKNKFQPVAVASNSLLTPSSLGATATEHGPVQALPNCLQPPKHLDLLHTPAKLLAAYGIPARDPNMPLSKWLEMASGMTLHVCQTWETNGYMEPNPAWHTGGVGPLVSIQYKNQSWTGKVADQNCGSTGANYVQ